LLYSPAQVGLATLMVAQEELLLQQQQEQQQRSQSPTTTTTTTTAANRYQFRIDWMQYLKHRFANETTTALRPPQEFWTTLCNRLRALKQGEFGCGRYETSQTSLAVLKGIHKKLKKVRYWGGGGAANDSANSSKKDAKKKKDKKLSSSTDNRDNAADATHNDGDGRDVEEPAKKRIKTE
jgi:hypothetical protein